MRSSAARRIDSDHFAPAPLTPDAVIAALTYCEKGCFPEAAVRAVLAEPRLYVERLLAELVLTPEELDGKYDDAPGESGYWLHTFAIYLLAQLGEPRAFRPLIDFFSTPGDAAHDSAGDGVIEDLPRILANVFDGDFEGLKGLIENEHANLYCRIHALDAFGCLVHLGKVPYEVLLGYVTQALERIKLDAGDEFTTWLVCFALDLREPSLRPRIQWTFDQGLIETGIVGSNSVEMEYGSTESRLFERLAKRSVPLDVLEDFPTWEEFRPPEPRKAVYNIGFRAARQRMKYWGTVVRDEPKIGRNDPCPCESGKKHKKCCLEPDG